MPTLTDDQCDCPYPLLWENESPVLGRAVRVRLCCMNKLLEEIYETSFIQVWDSEPAIAWDGDGKMPAWMQRRYDEKKAEGFSMEPAYTREQLVEELEYNKDAVKDHIHAAGHQERVGEPPWARDGKHT